MNPVRVLVVDDQQLLRRGLVMLFSTIEGVEVVGEAAHGEEALAVLRSREVDVVLADAKMPVMDGVTLVRRAAELHPGLPVLVLTTFDEPDIVQGAIAAGAAGFLLKDTSIEGLADAVQAVHHGGMVIDPRVARLALTAPQGDGEPEPPELAVLTPAERSIGELVARGWTNRQIAAHLVLAEGTVKNHVSALLRKLGAPDRTAAALALYQALHPPAGQGQEPNR